MLQITQLFLVSLLSTGTAQAHEGLNPMPDSALRDTYAYYIKGGSFFGAEEGIATEHEHYPSPTGELMYYCVNPRHDRGNHKYGNECCSAVLDKIREFFVCTTPSCQDGEFWYMNQDGNVVGKSLLSERDRVEPHREHETGLTSFRTCD